MRAGNQPGLRARCTFPPAGQQQFWRPEKGQGNVTPFGECYSLWSIRRPGLRNAANPLRGAGCPPAALSAVARMLAFWSRARGTRVRHLTMAKVAGVMVLNDPS
ncbi:hypothetical protein VTP21DRAFT_9678 [Calcarisporiella thermophila]